MTRYRDPERFPPTDTGKCNTHAGYQIHDRRNQWACDGCLVAHTNHTKAAHIVKGRRKALIIPVAVLREWLNNPQSVGSFLPDIIVYAIKNGQMPKGNYDGVGGPVE